MKRKFMQVFAFILAFILFISCPLSVYASEKWEGSLGLTLYYNKDKILQYFKDTGEFWLYGASQLGAIVKSDFVSFAENKKKMDDILSEGNKVGVYVDENDNAKGMFFSKEFMAELKALIEQYAKENEPYYIGKTYAFDTADFSALSGRRNVYNTIKNLLNESKSGFIICSYNYDGSIWFADIDRNFADLSFVKVRGNDRLIGIYDNDTWKRLNWKVYYTKLSSDDEEIKTAAEFKERAISTYSGSSWDYSLTQEARVMLSQDSYFLESDSQTIYSWAYLVSKETRRVRVFNDFSDFQNYTLGKRKVYYTSNYYNYVPEDLSVSIDDLQKTVDDLSKVIDELLKQIQDNTDESEIEELLRQILEALKNQQGTGGGGSGGGDVNVDIDLTTTNTLLSKILAKVTQIFDKMNTAVEDAEDAAFAKIQESLDEIIVQLKKIKRWTAVDTVIDGVDAIGDWLDLIRDVIKDAKEGTGSAVAAVSSAVSDSTDLMTKKFPFSAPWDLFFLISFFSAEPEVPYFEIPFCIPYYDFEYTFVIDFKDYQWLSDVIRPILLMVYAVGLLSKTPSILSISKEN